MARETAAQARSRVEADTERERVGRVHRSNTPMPIYGSLDAEDQRPRARRRSERRRAQGR